MTTNHCPPFLTATKITNFVKLGMYSFTFSNDISKFLVGLYDRAQVRPGMASLKADLDDGNPSVLLGKEIFRHDFRA